MADLRACYASGILQSPWPVLYDFQFFYFILFRELQENLIRSHAAGEILHLPHYWISVTLLTKLTSIFFLLRIYSFKGLLHAVIV